LLVGVVSDSHDDVASVRKVAEFLHRSGVEAVIHLGDIIAPFTLRELAKGVGGAHRGGLRQQRLRA